MSTRTELPWDKIQKEIVSALHTMALNQGEEFFVVNVKRIADHVSMTPEEYPTINKGVSHKGIMGRTTMSLLKHGWTKWNNGTRCGTGMKFIVPWRKIRC